MRINQIVPITLVSFLIMSGAIAQTFAHDKGEREGSDKRKEEWRIEAKKLDEHMENLDKYGDYCDAIAIEVESWGNKERSRKRQLDAVCHIKQGDFIEGIFKLKSALNYEPKNAKIHNRLAELYNLQKQYDKAIQSSNEAIKLDSKLDSAYVNKGDALCGKYEFTAAGAEYNKAIALNKKNVNAYIGKAKIVGWDIDKIREGIKACDIGLKIARSYDKNRILHKLKGDLLAKKAEKLEKSEIYKNPRSEKIEILYAAINEYGAAGRGRSYSGHEELDLDSLAGLARDDLAKEYFLIAKEELDRLHKLYPDDKKIKETLLALCNYPGVTLSNICPESEEKAASLFSSDEWTKKLSDFGNLKPLAKNTKKEGKNMGAGK